MRRWIWFLVAAFGGCTRLNGAFDDGQRTVTGDGTEASSTGVSTTEITTTTDSTSGVMSIGEDTTEGPSLSSTSISTTDAPPVTTSESTGGSPVSSEDGDSATGNEVRVIFLYAVDGWMGGANLIPKVQPEEHCASQMSGPTAMLCDGPPVALLRRPDVDLAEVLNFLDAEQWSAAEVFGVGSNGSNPLADSPAELLASPLNTTLAQGGVEDPSGDGVFYSGGPGIGDNTCNGWQSQDPGDIGSLGSFVETVGWFSSGSNSCNLARPLLCACRSVPNPF